MSDDRNQAKFMAMKQFQAVMFHWIVIWFLASLRFGDITAFFVASFLVAVIHSLSVWSSNRLIQAIDRKFDEETLSDD